ncbi:MAG: STAS domain-containing protein [Puniceicoccales bacterium]|nr:STAS domain-containing protein [Puniceicoccales bacterium]
MALEAWKAGLWNRANITRNLFSGIVVGVISLPLSMAFAIASGVTPEVGIYTAVVACLCVSLLGGSRYQIAGPTGAFVPLLLGILREYGLSGLQLATLMAGVILIVMGLLKFGRLLKYIPTQVLVGFTSGIGTMLFLGQINQFFGIRGNHFSIDFPTTLIGFTCLVMIIISRLIPYMRHIPAPLLALLAGGILQAIFHFPSVATIGSEFNGITSSFPGLSLPTGITWNLFLSLLGPAFAIALLGAIESLLSAVVADGMTGSKHQANQELIGQGIANILSPLFGGIAATGAIARTAANVRAGGNSPLSGIVSVGTLLFILLFCAPLAQSIPLAALAAILFVISYHMFGFAYFIHLLRHAPVSDVIILLITYALTVVCGLMIAVNVGIVLSALSLMQRMSTAIHIDCNKSHESEEDMRQLANLPPATVVYTVSGPLFFAAMEKLEFTVSQINSDVMTIILRLGEVPFVDTTALAHLRRLIETFEAAGRKFIFCEASRDVAHKLHRVGIEDSLRDENPQKTLKEAIRCQD